MTETKGFYSKIYFAVISGICAAFGSLFGKLFGLFDEASISLLSEYLPMEDGKEMVSGCDPQAYRSAICKKMFHIIYIIRSLFLTSYLYVLYLH
jgi:hypothetical protein